MDLVVSQAMGQVVEKKEKMAEQVRALNNTVVVLMKLVLLLVRQVVVLVEAEVMVVLVLKADMEEMVLQVTLSPIWI